MNESPPKENECGGCNFPTHKVQHLEMSDRFVVGVLTISDRVSKGTAQDLSGPKAVEVLQQHLNNKTPEFVTKVVPDESEDIKASLIHWCSLGYGLIVTTGNLEYEICNLMVIVRRNWFCSKRCYS